MRREREHAHAEKHFAADPARVCKALAGVHGEPHWGRPDRRLDRGFNAFSNATM